MKNKITLIAFLMLTIITNAQVGVNTANPQGILHVDGAKDNSATGTPSSTQQANDFIVTSSGAIGIGTTSPDASSMLDIVTTDKGMLVPRVNLTSPTFVLSTATPAIPNAKGLLVFNSGSTLSQGYYFWNGSEWRAIISSTSTPPSIATLSCSGATLSPANYVAGTPYSGIIKVPYTGGNGGKYTPGSSVSSNGLTLTLQEGLLEVGNGYLTFSVAGIPTVSSPTPTSFIVNSTIIPFYSGTCTITVGDQQLADVKSIAVMGPLVATSDNGRSGYSLSITTPDGKFSVRTFIPAGNAFSTVNLQIRNNSTSNVEIISNGHYLWSGAGGYMQNQLRLPPNAWAGDNATSSSALIDATTGARIQTSSTNPYWGDPETYAGGMPEQRLYSWTTNNGNDKVFYKMYYMMGSSSPTDQGNTTTCPSGTCNTTKAFFMIDQVTAP
ncbi:hypothetical protein JI747_002445 [Chryseobacterium sp. RG1]|uniref:Uncharacterized protein n=1 Tax=Chryseobacterium tagetis TaxID=2801334 RepID=A0ABS7ZWB2_9FLAO|nr:hypothetical protein [Chryseobacterium tagetis]MCA6066019.1 hypothetical protein [Chryseobacterium tagetis]